MRVFAATLILISTFPALLPAQGQATIVGRVVEFGGRSGIAGAAVNGPGLPQTLTQADGRFTITVPRGERTFTISAPGYHTRELSLVVRRDTSLIIELEPQPFQLESLTVRARTITVRGVLTDQTTGKTIFDADVIVAGTREGSSNLIGSFKVRRVPAGTPVNVEARAIGYLPFTSTMTIDRDTTMRIALAPDPLAMRMLEQQVQRLEVRTRGLPFARDTWTRADLERYPISTVADLLRTRFRRTSVPCLFIDDQDRSFGSEEIIKTYLVDELDRIEVIDRGTMVRMYTRRYIMRLTAEKKLPPVVLVKALSIMCM
jgi:hypothetical protein